MDNQTPIKQTGHYVDQLVLALRDIFKKFADPNKMEGNGVARDGIKVLYNTKTLGLVRFIFRTTEELEIDMQLDLRRMKDERTAREFLQTVLQELRTKLAGAEIARAETQGQIVTLH